MTDTQSQSQLDSILYHSADVLRNDMKPAEYQDYLLTLMFYTCISKEQIINVKHTEKEQGSKIPKQMLQTYCANQFGYYIPKQYLSTTFVQEITAPDDSKNSNYFTLDGLKAGFKQIEQYPSFHHIFQDCHLNSNALGKTEAERTRKIAKVLVKLSDIDFTKYSGDAIGDGYEYLLGKFASNTGSKAGEFYTPQQVAKLLASLTITAHQDSPIQNVDDPCLGSASLLLKYRNQYMLNHKHANEMHFYGREVNHDTYNLARMNLAIHNIKYGNQTIHWGDTLSPKSIDDSKSKNSNGNKGMDIVVTNPPFSHQWGKDGSNDWQNAKKDNDPRFKDYGIAPKTKADYAFLLHGLYQLNDKGVMAIVLPNGPLFRGGQEGKIRKHLIQHHNIDTVIALPQNLFFSTSIPTIILILRKVPKHNNVLFIDASKLYKHHSKRNYLQPQSINKIITALKNRKNVRRFSHVASYNEIKNNNYDLNIPRYVDTFVPEPDISINKTEQEIDNINTKITQSKNRFEKMTKQLVWTNEGSNHDDK